MKKLFLVGALAASMAFSSSALAAVEYGESTNLKFAYDNVENTISVETDLSSFGDQMTIVAVVGDGNTISDSNIMYIDQAASGAGIFQDMGLLMPTYDEEVTTDEGTKIVKVPYETLPAGNYTVVIGGTNLGTEATPLLKATLTIAEEETGTPISFVFGDVTGDDAANTDDAVAIMGKLVGGGADVGGLYEIATELTLIDNSIYVFGDVNGDDAANTDDAVAIMGKLVGGGANVGGDFDIGADATYTLK